MDLKLPDFPTLKSIRGLGLSDSDVYSGRLASRFSYTNTFYHREPVLDLSTPDTAEFGRYDFVICSDVLEHVLPPLEPIFETLCRLLKPEGVLILTVPYTSASSTIEHFSALHRTALVEVNGKLLLVNCLPNGEYRVYEDVKLHGGEGSTLEMRIFSEEDLRNKLTVGGFRTVHFGTMANRRFGVVFSGPCSLPIVAEKAPFVLSKSAIQELLQQFATTRLILSEAKSSRWVKAGRVLGLGPDY